MCFSTKLKILIFILFSAVTLVPGQLFDRYLEVGPELLQNPGFAQGDTSWQINKSQDSQVTFDKDFVKIESPRTDQSGSVFQVVKLQNDIAKLRLQGDLSSVDVVGGKNPWNRARLLMVQYSEGNRIAKMPHSAAAIDETTPWQHYIQDFSIDSTTTELKVVAQLSSSAGAFLVRALSLREIRQSDWYGFAKSLSWVIWIGFIIYLLIPYLNACEGWFSSVMLSLAVLAILVGATVPGKVKQEWIETIKQQVPEVGMVSRIEDEVTIDKDGEVSLLNIIVDISKLGHFLFFGALGFSIYFMKRSCGVILLMLDILLFAGATELLQLYVDGRSPMITDVIIDCAGGFFGVIAGRWPSNIS